MYMCMYCHFLVTLLHVYLQYIIVYVHVHVHVRVGTGAGDP